MASFQRLLTQIRASIELLLAAFPFVTEIDFKTKALFLKNTHVPINALLLHIMKMSSLNQEYKNYVESCGVNFDTLTNEERRQWRETFDKSKLATTSHRDETGN